jgi:hypothetical protein
MMGYVSNIVKGFVFAERAIRGLGPYDVDEDKTLVPKLNSGRTRLFFPIIPETQHLTQLERIGVLYFVSLVFDFDSAIDNNVRLKTQKDRQSLEATLLNMQMDKADITFGELKNKTLSHFPLGKQEKLESLWTTMIAYHAHLADRVGEQKAGQYSYDDALAYREATNDAFVEVLCALCDIAAPAAIAKEKQRVFLIQLLDDALDWPEDVADYTYNLFVGLASQHYPQEFDLMSRHGLMLRYNEARPLLLQGSQLLARKQFMRQYMPRTSGAYLATFDDELRTVCCRPTRLAYRAIRGLAI